MTKYRFQKQINMYKFNFLLLFPILLLFSCSKEEVTVGNGGGTPPVPPVVDTSGYSFLALGDSYTFGSGLLEEQSWPFQLVDRLETLDVKITDLDVIASSGWNTDYLLDQINQQQPTIHDLVSLQIGVNDQFQGRTFEMFQAGFDQLLTKAIELAGGRENVMVVSIPDYGVTPFGGNDSEQIGEELDEFNAYILQQCLLEDIPFIDVTQISRDLGDGENALAPDNLHPSEAQYTQWVYQIWPVAKEILED